MECLDGRDLDVSVERRTSDGCHRERDLNQVPQPSSICFTFLGDLGEDIEGKVDLRSLGRETHPKRKEGKGRKGRRKKEGEVVSPSSVLRLLPRRHAQGLTEDDRRSSKDWSSRNEARW